MATTSDLLRDFNRKESVKDAVSFVRGLTRLIGPGFHPDTPFADYVETVPPHLPCFTSKEAQELDRELDRARAILDGARIDICAVALPVQRQLLRRLGVR